MAQPPSNSSSIQRAYAWQQRLSNQIGFARRPQSFCRSAQPLTPSKRIYPSHGHLRSTNHPSDQGKLLMLHRRQSALSYRLIKFMQAIQADYSASSGHSDSGTGFLSATSEKQPRIHPNQIQPLPNSSQPLIHNYTPPVLPSGSNSSIDN
ncbi:hypothetical protein PCANC_11309 [Puccinia coronata f. sp. avenae]|uniref:Uncharacterized protein n=1 Tax=Puccinia coronata f. sp. avenae TaxID=200324 RepID=A0A2N5V175_9BASI|nr:hypothetical protein PCASD_09362 [Puccinia coronata f. sp. avenae]PLW45178.1 hypothetical protein PCANC_11309 [Puccinia coronata f. sp. avenae]